MLYLVDASQIHHFVERMGATFDHVDLLANSAGVADTAKLFGAMNDEEWGNGLMDMAFRDRRSRARSAADISIYSLYRMSIFCVRL